MTTPINEVPWMIEGGAKHTVQVARNLAYMAAGGTEGIILGADLEVRETAVPGSTVRVFPGTAAVENRAAGAFNEMYVFRVGSETEVAIAPTDASGGRSDLIVARVENPWASGETWPDPADPTVGPYASLAVISGVPANTNAASDLGLSADDSMIALARIDIPASTGTIDQSMITDLRVMSGAVSKREFVVAAPTAADTMNSAGYRVWPNEISLTVDIPDWATHAKCRAILGGVKFSATATGHLRFLVGARSGDIHSQATAFNLPDPTGTDRTLVMAAAPRLPIPKSDRGDKSILIRLEGERSGGAGNITVDTSSMVSIEVEFINEPESNV